MKLKKYQTYNVGNKDIKKEWYIIDAAGKSMGRVAVKAAYILRGKHKAIYTPYLDTGDNVIIINASKAAMTGKKFMDKIYYSHTGFPGGIRSVNYAKLIAKKPTKPLEMAIKGMLPKGPLGRNLFRNLRIYSGDSHNHNSQNLIKVDL